MNTFEAKELSPQILSWITSLNLTLDHEFNLKWTGTHWELDTNLISDDVHYDFDEIMYLND